MTARSLMAVFAHPDDESLAMGGTLARYAAEGVELSLVCATRGEWGPRAHELEPGESLADVRERELRAACQVLGVGWLRILGYPDGVLASAAWRQMEGEIVRLIRERRPGVLVTFGPDGMYGHGDHIAVGAIVTAAFASAADEASFPEHLESGLAPHAPQRLYYVALPETLMRELLGDVEAEHGAAHFWGLSAERFGVPHQTITTSIDVRENVGAKLRALRCHRSQLDADHAFHVMSDAIAARHFGYEYFRRAAPEGAGEETGLFD